MWYNRYNSGSIVLNIDFIITEDVFLGVRDYFVYNVIIEKDCDSAGTLGIIA